MIREEVCEPEFGRIELAASSAYPSPSHVEPHLPHELFRLGLGQDQLDHEPSERRVARLGEAALEPGLELRGRVGESGREGAADEMLIVQSLDHEQPVRTQPREERFEGRPRLVEAVRSVVDDEAERLSAELFLEDCRLSLPVRLVNAVMQADAVAEAALRDQLVERFSAVWADVSSSDVRLGGTCSVAQRRRDKPESLLLSRAIGGANGGDPSGTEFPVRFEVNYVRVYGRAGR